MKYMGSKSRIAKYIVPILQNYINENKIKTYCEPFCGGCNIIDKIVCENKIAGDNQKYLIALLSNLDKINTLPEFISKEHYSEVRTSYNLSDNKFEDWYIGAIGFLASYNGRFFDGGYAGIVHTKANTIRNYYDEAKRNLEEQVDKLGNIIFTAGDYTQFSYLEKALIYCDIPYFGTKQYGSSKNFDYERFWEWAEIMSKNNIVIISEEYAPSNFKCIWQEEIKRTIDNNKRLNAIEKLFKISEVEECI